MNLFNEAARMFFALFALILTTMLIQPTSFNMNPLGQLVSVKDTGKPHFKNFQKKGEEPVSQVETPPANKKPRHMKIAGTRFQNRNRWR